MSILLRPMRAIITPVYGGSEVLQYQEVAVPSIKPDEILVQVHSAGVSPFDIHVRDGWYKASPNYPLPIILGWELSGKVVAIGTQTSRFREGDEIFAHPSVYRSGGAYAEYVAVKEIESTHKPATMSHHQAAALSMNALTAWQALFDVAQLTANQKILIHAAAGGVGHLAVQLAKWRGAYVIGTASAKNKEFLSNLGADEIIDYTNDPFENLAKDVDVVLDTIGGETLIKSFSITKKNGIVVSIVDFENIKLAPKFGIRGENVIVSPNFQQLSKIANLFEEKMIQAHIETIFPLAEASKSHIQIQSGHTCGKIVLAML
jgi:NADPH:quinone reductase-like Zn-dependent oxidoreductase